MPPTPLPMPVPGDRLESFELHDAVGVGGMGAVFLATDTRLQRQVALKILPPEQSSDIETVQRFYQEGRAAARLDHENIARVYTIGTDRGYHFIAFEYIEGTTLRQKVEQSGPLSVAETINYTLQIANALVHASERGVVHRDIKPSNIIVTPQGRAKLVDMGLARRFERGASDDGLTQSGMTLGTFDYISPEQARDPRDVDVRSDLYSLGCTMFHMLTGRPPFPDGTVLQKLLQHQEEPAPDVRTVNASVPADLASILLKLMAKDRDRRYQSPEQLVRDLLLVAGAQGMRSVSPEGLVWLAGNRAPAWEQHVFWALPAVGLALVVLTLLWWGQVGEPMTDRPTGLDTDGPRMSSIEPTLPTPPRSTSSSGPSETTPESPSSGLVTLGPTGPPIVRSIPVSATEDLAQVLAKAPSGSTLTLTDDGPYLLRPEVVGKPGPTSGAPGRDLTIRAAEGALPRLRMRLDRGLEPLGSELALLVFRGGHILIDGLEFELDASMLDDPLSGIWAEDASLSVSRCRFRRLGTRPDLVPPQAISVRMTGRSPETASSARPEPVRVLGSHFDGGQVAVKARGSADIVARDSTFGPVEPAIWFDNSGALGLVPASVSMDRVRVIAGVSPVFRFQKTAAHVSVGGSVIAAPDSGTATLVATDEPEALDWFGRDNLYGQIGVFLQPTDGRPDHASEVIGSFSVWADDSEAIREIRSTATTHPVWTLDETDQVQALSLRDPSSAFSVEFGAGLNTDELIGRGRPSLPPRTRPSDHVDEPVPANRRPPGGLLARLLDSPLIRRGPGLATPPSSEPVQERPGSLDLIDPERIETLSGLEPVPGEAPPAPLPITEGTASTTDEPPSTVSSTPEVRPPYSSPGSSTTPNVANSRPSALDEPMPMVRMPLGTSESETYSSTVASSPVTTTSEPSGATTSVASKPPSTRTEHDPSSSSRPMPVSPMPDRPTVVGPLPEAAEAPKSTIHTRSDFDREFGRLGARGGILLLASDADLNLSTVVIPKAGRWTIQAVPASSRPILRFAPDPDTTLSGLEVASLFRVAPGAALELIGVDVVLGPGESSEKGRRAAFAVGAGSDLTLTNCSVTVSGQNLGGMNRSVPSSVVAVVAEPGAGAGGMAADTSAASVRITQSLVRSAGDLVDVSAGIRLDDLSLSNVVSACAGSLVHGHGLPRGQTSQSIKLVMRQVTARAEGGLVRLESAPGEPDLPATKVIARDSILATTPEGDPLVRIEGQDGLDTLRDRVSWEGHSVYYHQIDTYRRDQTALSGTSPVGFKRPSWEVAVGPSEDAPGHGDAQFVHPWPTDRPLWTIEPGDVALEPNSPAWGSGADLDRIPLGPSGE